LNADGDWAWGLTITPAVSGTPTAGLPVAAELGLRETGPRALLGATKNATNFPDDNPGVQIFTWETLTDVDPSPTVTNNRPVGLQHRCPSGCTSTGAEDEVFAALGSIDFAAAGAQNFLTVNVARPVTTNATTASVTTLAVLGKHHTGNAEARIAQINGGLGINYALASAGLTRQARGGDVNLDGNVSIADYSTLTTNFNGPATGQRWQTGDFNGDGDVSIADYSQLTTNITVNDGGQPGLNYDVTPDANYALTGVVDPPPASFSGGGSLVPEPTSLLLLAMASLGLAALRVRR
jgi:hypothetical protein